VYELKKNGKVFTSKSVGTGPSFYEQRIYRAAVSQGLRNTGPTQRIILPFEHQNQKLPGSMQHGPAREQPTYTTTLIFQCRATGHSWTVPHNIKSHYKHFIQELRCYISILVSFPGGIITRGHISPHQRTSRCAVTHNCRRDSGHCARGRQHRKGAQRKMDLNPINKRPLAIHYSGTSHTRDS